MGSSLIPVGQKDPLYLYVCNLIELWQFIFLDDKLYKVNYIEVKKTTLLYLSYRVVMMTVVVMFLI